PCLRICLTAVSDTSLSTLPLPDALPISCFAVPGCGWCSGLVVRLPWCNSGFGCALLVAFTFQLGNLSRPASRAFAALTVIGGVRSEEHTSELQSRENLVCRLPLATKNTA